MYRIFDPDENNQRPVKPHFISTQEVKDEVKKNLTERFGFMSVEDRENNTCSWDPGGMCLDPDETFSFPLDNITITCKAQHFNKFAYQVGNRKPRGNIVKYVKLHGFWTCICISVEEFEQLKVLIEDEDLVKRASEIEEKRNMKFKELKENGVVVFPENQYDPDDDDGVLH